jgi:hypothetical protein
MADGKKKLINLVVDRYVNLELFYKNQEPQATGCINWTGVTSNIGYGFIGFNYLPGNASPSGHRSGMMTTHRLAFMVANNRLPVKRNVNHTCHNKLCVNPAHLVEGTQREKLTAMVAAGIKGGCRKGQQRGSYNHKQQDRVYKYSEEEIQWIRTADVDLIAARYGMAKSRASSKRWAFRTNYKWLPCPPLETQQKRGRKPRAK